MRVRVNGREGFALVDTRCTQTLVCKACCDTWDKKRIPVLTVGRGMLASCGVSVLRTCVGDGHTITVRALVVSGDLLGYDLLLGMECLY